MALSGSFDTSKYNSKKWLRFSWTATQSIANNTSTISWSVVGVGSESGYHMAGPITVKINGEQVYYSATRIQLRDGTAVASGTKTINHATDGSGSFSASIDAAIYSSSVNCSGSGTYALDAIARASTLTNAPAGFYDTESPTITFYNPSETYWVQACISLTGASADISYRDVSWNLGTQTYTFNLTSAEKNTLYAATTNANSRGVYFFVRTVVKSGDVVTQVIGTSAKYATFRIYQPEPTMTVNFLKDTNSTTVALTGSNTVFVKGYSNAYWKTTCAAVKGASLTSQYAINNGNTLNGSGSGGVKEGTVTGVSNGRFDFYAKDSRGNTRQTTVTRSVVNYVPLTAAQTVGMPDTSGNFSLSIAGDYWSGNFGAAANSLTLKYKVYPKNSTEPGWTVISGSATLSNNKFSKTITVSIPDFDEATTYIVKAQAVDALNTKTTDEYAIRLTPIFSWSDNDFAFTVPVSFQGNTLNEIVIAQGTSGGWNYRKWSSGRLELYGYASGTLSNPTAWGSVYYAPTPLNKTFPTETGLTFTSEPYVFSGLYSSSGGWLEIDGRATTTKTANYYFTRPVNSGFSGTWGVSFYVIGRWRD